MLKRQTLKEKRSSALTLSSDTVVDEENNIHYYHRNDTIESSPRVKRKLEINLNQGKDVRFMLLFPLVSIFILLDPFLVLVKFI